LASAQILSRIGERFVGAVRIVVDPARIDVHSIEIPPRFAGTGIFAF